MSQHEPRSQHLLEQFPVVRGLAGGLGLATALVAHRMLDALRLVTVRITVTVRVKVRVR